MEDLLYSMWGNLRLSEAEDTIIDIEGASLPYVPYVQSKGDREAVVRLSGGEEYF